MPQYVAVTKHLNPDGSVTLTNELDGSTEHLTGDRAQAVGGSGGKDDDTQDRKDRKRPR